MTGKQLAPIGDLPFETLIGVYKEQAAVLADAGVDLFVVETMMSLQETRAALIAIREVCDLPIMASLTYESDGRTLYGTDAKTAMVVLQSLGADAVGLNCSTGPAEMVSAVEQMREIANIPVLAKPNAEVYLQHTAFRRQQTLFLRTDLRYSQPLHRICQCLDMCRCRSAAAAEDLYAEM